MEYYFETSSLTSNGYGASCSAPAQNFLEVQNYRKQSTYGINEQRRMYNMRSGSIVAIFLDTSNCRPSDVGVCTLRVQVGPAEEQRQIQAGVPIELLQQRPTLSTPIKVSDFIEITDLPEQCKVTLVVAAEAL